MEQVHDQLTTQSKATSAHRSGRAVELGLPVLAGDMNVLLAQAEPRFDFPDFDERLG